MVSEALFTYVCYSILLAFGATLIGKEGTLLSVVGVFFITLGAFNLGVCIALNLQ